MKNEKMPTRWQANESWKPAEGSTPPCRKMEPINKRPGRVVCICTAKGHIVYHEEWPTGRKDN